MKSAPRGGRLAGRRSRPPRPGAGWPSGLRGCRAMDRRAAGLGARGDHAAPAPGWLTGYPPAVRVGGGGGGRSRARRRGRPGSRLRRACGTEGCLSQRRELECRSHGTTHQLAKRAFVRSAGRQLGEHVFEKGRGGVGRNGRTFRHPLRAIWLKTAENACLCCNASCRAQSWRLGQAAGLGGRFRTSPAPTPGACRAGARFRRAMRRSRR